MNSHTKKTRIRLAMKCGVDFKLNLTNGSRNVSGKHGNKATRFLSRLSKVVIYKNHSLVVFLRLSTFFLREKKFSTKKITHHHRRFNPKHSERTVLIPPFALL